MMTLRRYLASQYDVTGLSAKLYRSKTWEIAVLSFVGLLVLSLVYFYHSSVVDLAFPDFMSTPMGMEHMFGLINLFTRVVFLIPLVFILLNALRMYRFTMRSSDRLNIPLRLYVFEARTMIIHMLSHRNIRKCADTEQKKRWTRHWLLGLGFALMSVILFFFLKWFQTDNIYPFYHPQRMLGYFATAILVIVPADILIGRILKREPMHKFSQTSDLTLPILLLLTGLSGIAVHISRYLGFSLTAHFLYAIHLAISVPLLVVEVPFGKLSHVIYRPLAIYFQAVKDRALNAGASDVRGEPAFNPVPEEAEAA
jgi:quinone-modifying oxidoreductase subunit QmoC